MQLAAPSDRSTDLYGMKGSKVRAHYTSHSALHSCLLIVCEQVKGDDSLRVWKY